MDPGATLETTTTQIVGAGSKEEAEKAFKFTRTHELVGIEEIKE